MKLKITIENEFGQKLEMKDVDANTFRKVIDHGFKDLSKFFKTQSERTDLVDSTVYAQFLEDLEIEQSTYDKAFKKVCKWLVSRGDI